MVKISSESSVRRSTDPAMELLPEEIVNANLNAAPQAFRTTQYIYISSVICVDIFLNLKQFVSTVLTTF